MLTYAITLHNVDYSNPESPKRFGFAFSIYLTPVSHFEVLNGESNAMFTMG